MLLHVLIFPCRHQAVPHLRHAKLHKLLNCSFQNYNFIKLLELLFVRVYTRVHARPAH